MKGLHLLALNAFLSAALIFAASEADAQRQQGGSGPRNWIPSGGGQTGPGINSGTGVGMGRDHHRGHKRGGDVWLVENEVVEVVEVEKEVPAAAPADPAAAAPPPEKREPFAVGKSYDSLPPGCMKLIQDGASYYFCGGAEWYQPAGGGRYKAVAQP